MSADIHVCFHANTSILFKRIGPFTLSVSQRQYLQELSLANNLIADASGIVHPRLTRLNLACACMCSIALNGCLSFSIALSSYISSNTGNKLNDVLSLRASDVPTLTFLDLHGNKLTSTISIRVNSLTDLYLVGAVLRCLPFIQFTHHVFCIGDDSCVFIVTQ